MFHAQTRMNCDLRVLLVGASSAIRSSFYRVYRPSMRTRDVHELGLQVRGAGAQAMFVFPLRCLWAVLDDCAAADAAVVACASNSAVWRC